MILTQVSQDQRDLGQSLKADSSLSRCSSSE